MFTCNTCQYKTIQGMPDCKEQDLPALRLGRGRRRHSEPSHTGEIVRKARIGAWKAWKCNFLPANHPTKLRTNRRI